MELRLLHSFPFMARIWFCEDAKHNKRRGSVAGGSHSSGSHPETSSVPET